MHYTPYYHQWQTPVYYGWQPYSYYVPNHYHTSEQFQQRNGKLKDYGPRPFVININEASKQNNSQRPTSHSKP